MMPLLLNDLVVGPVIQTLGWTQPRERQALLLAIAIQESGLIHRRQRPRGPARSYWQIEPPTAMDCLQRCKPIHTPLDEFALSRYCDPLSLPCSTGRGEARHGTGDPNFGDPHFLWPASTPSRHHAV